MSQQPSDKEKQSAELDATLDSLLAKQVEPTADFTARVFAEVRDTKVVQGPWQQAKQCISIALTAAAAISIAIGLNNIYSPDKGEAKLFIEDITSEVNPFLDNDGEEGLADEAPDHAIDLLLNDPDSLPSIDALLDEPMLLDLNMLLES